MVTDKRYSGVGRAAAFLGFFLGGTESRMTLGRDEGLITTV